MSNNSLPLKELSINDVFNGSENVNYEIPIYQRNYAWGKDEITALVRDVWDACEKNKEPYYIGTLVTYAKGDGTYEVIDGQQRLTTLFLLLIALKVKMSNRLTYRARTRSIKALEVIKNGGVITSNELDSGITTGYSNITQAINETVDADDKFKEFLLHKVHIIHYNVPRDVDLNHYFEVMNSRGEQLEKHEIVKAKLIKELDESEKTKFAAIWDACSEMNVYIQTKEVVQKCFSDKLEAFTYFDKTFDDLPVGRESVAEPFTVMRLINENKDQNKDQRSNKDDGSKNSMFQPIIDFPNFLLIVLKITLMRTNNFEPKDFIKDFILDDKELINEFDTALEKKQDFVKCFCYNLIKAKYLLDNYVVHHANEEDTYNHNPWQLRYWSKEEEGSTKNRSTEVSLQNKLVQLLSMFEVSFTAHQRKNYLFYVLYHLFENRDLDLDIYLNFLENLAKKYFFDIYMMCGKPRSFDEVVISAGSVNVVNVEIENSNVTSTTFTNIYGYDSEKIARIPLFVFNYMDYCIWKKYANEMAGKSDDLEKRKKFFDDLGCSDFGLDVFKQFYFSSTRRSLEHYFPQANINDKMSEDKINCFGNFAMIGSEANSSGSNWSPKVKLDHYLDSSKKIQQVGVASLKFRIMMQMCSDNTKDEKRKGSEWIDVDINKHQDKMLEILGIL